MLDRDGVADSAWVRGIQEQLLQAAGGSYSVPEAAVSLGISETSLRQHIRRGTLLELRFRGRLCIPACQIEQGRMIPGLEQVLRAMPVRHGWTQLGDLLEPLYALGGNRSLLDLIGAGEPEYAAELASRLHETGGL